MTTSLEYVFVGTDLALARPIAIEMHSIQIIIIAFGKKMGFDKCNEMIIHESHT